MSISVKTNFTAGQVSSNIFGRGDITFYENGARKLENVIIHPTGGVSRRFGLKYIDEVAKKSRLIPFEFNTEQTYLLCLFDHTMKVYRNEECVAVLETPWSEEQLFDLNWTQSADTLLIVHSDVEPRQISRGDNENWNISPWIYHEDNGMIFQPFFNFYQRKTWLECNSGFTAVTAEGDIFTPDMLGSMIKVHGGILKVTGYRSANSLDVIIHKKPSSSSRTTDWEELAFSNRRGWPVSVTFHQDRMVIGGSRSLPNRIWLSKSSDLFNFDLGEGLDDEAIEFAILSDQVNAIKHVVSSRHLLVFTTGAEWMVTGDPLTPSSIQLMRQTNVGVYAKKHVAPQQVDGASIFISRNGQQLKEFLFADVEQAYLAKDLTLISSQIISEPIDVAFDAEENLLYFVLKDGSISCLTSYRTENVNAWSKLTTNGQFFSAAVSGDDTYFCVCRNQKYFIEKKAKGFFVDSGIQLISETPIKKWTGLERFNDQEVTVVADGFNAGKHKVIDGCLDILDEASKISVGYSFEHAIEPLPYMKGDGGLPYSPIAYRVVNCVFKLLETNAFCIDMGKGHICVPLRRMSDDQILDADPISFCGDIKLSALGWIRDMNQPMWSIKSSEPSAFTLLSVVSEIKAKES